MCLLFQKPAAIILTNAQLIDMYASNQDGYGVMYAEEGKLYTVKGMGEIDDWIKFYREYETKSAIWHLRMRTHGHTDLTNCHPYTVFGFKGDPKGTPTAMMHNGILSTGNAADTSKSDTWHFIRDYIHPLAEKSTTVVFTDAFIEIVEKFIGPSNKFAFMNAKGQVAILNKKSGVTHLGIWFSNTYAWNPRNEAVWPGAKQDCGLNFSGNYYGGYNSGYNKGGLSDWDDFDRGIIKKPVSQASMPHATPSAKTVNAPKKNLYKDKRSKQKTGLPKAGKGKWDANHNVSDINGNVMRVTPQQPPLLDWKKPLQNQHVPSSQELAEMRDHYDALANQQLGTELFGGDVVDWSHDIDFIREGLEQDFQQASGMINDQQIENLLELYGVAEVYQLMEDAYGGPANSRPLESDLVDVFTNHNKAAAWFNSKLTA